MKCTIRAAIWLSMISVFGFSGIGCSQSYKPVHDGLYHAREVRGGKERSAGVIADIRDHVIIIDGQGVPHDPTSSNGRTYNMVELHAQIDNIFKAMDEFHKTHPGKKVLIFAHGGLNPPSHSLAAADRDLDRIEDAGYFPIFLNWDSGLGDSYGEHLLNITQGHTDNRLVRKLLTPFYFIADLGRAVTRVPIVWANQIGSDMTAAAADFNALGTQPPIANTKSGFENIATQRWAQSLNGQVIAQVVNGMEQKRQANPPSNERSEDMRIYIGRDMEVSSGHLAKLEAQYIATIPTKFGLSWLLDGLGTPAWHNMSRRTQMAFDGQLGGNPRYRDGLNVAKLRKNRGLDAPDFQTTGAFEVFRAAFFHRVEEQQKSKDTPYQVTVVAHSAGTMVINEWLRRDLLEDRPRAYQNIVYMAAACSIRDFARSVVPYLMVHRGAKPDGTDGTQFYSLMLHPLAELREYDAYDLPPRGSLLVWLDDFLTDPQTPLDRTLGRWDNLLPVIDLIPEAILGQVSLKAFAVAPKGEDKSAKNAPNYGPQMHGDFTDQAYWNPEFWFSYSDQIPGVDDPVAEQPVSK